MGTTEPNMAIFAILDTVSSSVFVHRGGNILFANASLARLTGYSCEELCAMPFYRIAHPDDHESLRECCDAILRDKQIPPPKEFRVLSKNHEIRIVQVKASLVKVHGEVTIVGSFFDLTERRRSEAMQRSMQRMLAEIIDGDPVPTFVIDADHVVTHWNKACAAVTGAPASEMIGTRRQWAPFYPAERPVMADLIVNGAMEGNYESHYKGKFRRSALIEGAFEAEDFFPHFGETGRWLYFTAAPLHDVDGKVNGAIETLQDVSARHAAEAKLLDYQAQLEKLVEQRTAQLESANEQLIQAEKLASIGQLAAGVAHEINNPIGYVFSNIGALEKYINDLFTMLAAYEKAEPSIAGAEQLAEVKTLREELDLEFLREDIPMLMGESKEGIVRVKKIVQDLKDFSHVDSAQEWQWADLHKGIDSTINIVSNEIKYKADVVKDYGNLPEVECMPMQLNQVFMNLLVNAAHAMPETRGTITIRTGVTGEKVWLEFSDNGSGIPEEIRQKIFDPFFTTKPIGKGTGLGLSLSYGIITNHNGSIEVASEVGKGTTFRIELPIKHEAAAAPAG
ncbi:MAG: PAS domain S-box protein [Zoogloeaceae bacterium]|nr:PAS domain S-box protein [Zoogloeaceae bacterium]